MAEPTANVRTPNAPVFGALHCVQDMKLARHQYFRNKRPLATVLLPA